MLKRSLLTFITIFSISIFIPKVAFSCICGGVNANAPFCTHVTLDDNVLLVEVLQIPVNTYYMEVKLIESLNPPFTEDTLLIAGTFGFDCLASLSSFQNNDTLILALYSAVQPYNFWPLDGCGRHSLRYENGIVTGAISDSISTMPYQQFKQNIFGCFSGTVSTENLIPAPKLNLYPNPSTAILNAESDHLIIDYEVFNSLGQTLFQAKPELTHSVKINTDQLDVGVYYLRIRTSKGIITRKFFKAI